MGGGKVSGGGGEGAVVSSFFAVALTVRDVNISHSYPILLHNFSPNVKLCG